MGNSNENYEDPTVSEATIIVKSDVLDKVRAEFANRQKAFLVAIEGPQTGQTYKLDRNETVIGRSPKTNLQIQDAGVSRRHARLFHSIDSVIVEDMGSANGTFVNGRQIFEETLLGDGDTITLGTNTILRFTYQDKLDEDFQNTMFEAALHDSLTKCYNKKYLLNQLQTELSYAIRHQQRLSLIMFDVDHFKNVNDTYGHLAGDYVLSKLAQVAIKAVRVEDTLARYGGEEFAIICRGLGPEQAFTFAERIRRDISSTQYLYDGEEIQIRISLGIATYPELEIATQKELIEAADGALYKAKTRGRDRTEIAQV